jgi:hypothetical protein
MLCKGGATTMMSVNFYTSEQDQKLIEKIRIISQEQRRSFSYIVREALELYTRQQTYRGKLKTKRKEKKK